MIDEHGNNIVAVIGRPGDDPLVIYSEPLDRETDEYIEAISGTLDRIIPLDEQVKLSKGCPDPERFKDEQGWEDD